MRNRRWIVFVLAAAVAVWAGVTVLAQMDMSDEDRAMSTFEELMGAPYTDWAFQPGVPEGFYSGLEPHGMVLRVYANDVAVADVEAGNGSHSEGAIIVKENHMPGDVDVSSMEQQTPLPDFGGNLASITYMVKIPGYNPDAGDWFWAKQQPDGTIDAAGKPEGCIGCHGQVSDNDYIFNVDLGGGM